MLFRASLMCGLSYTDRDKERDIIVAWSLLLHHVSTLTVFPLHYRECGLEHRTYINSFMVIYFV